MSIDTNYETLRKVLADHQPKGWAIEFGVYTGYSTAIIAEHMPVIGLDTFTGLPEDWRPGFPKGKFSDRHVLRHLRPGIAHNVMLLGGLFEDTLPPLLERGLPDIGLIHIDCDLYSSTITALEGMREYIKPGTIIVFDEYHGYEGWGQHEAKAWKEFCTEHRIIFRTIGSGPEELAVQIAAIGVL
jgi:predicted O-methyltransferase YrrM